MLSTHRITTALNVRTGPSLTSPTAPPSPMSANSIVALATDPPLVADGYEWRRLHWSMVEWMVVKHVASGTDYLRAYP